MNDFNITFDIDTTTPAAKLNVDVFVNDAQVFSKVIQGAESFLTSVPEADGEHELRIVLSGKLPEHTQIDTSGNIINDALVTIKNIQFDGVDCSEIVSNTSVYQHNFNGTGEQTETKFYDSMGCNGSLVIKFTTPIYLWILENM